MTLRSLASVALLGALALAIVTSCASDPVRPAPAVTPRLASAAGPEGHIDSAIEPPKELTEGLSRYCTDCHDGSNRLDLRTPPRDTQTWQRIAEALEGGRMPPQATGAPAPLDPQIRSSLIKSARRMIAMARPPTPRVVVLSRSTWETVVHDVADPSIGAEKVSTILRAHGGGGEGADGFGTSRNQVDDALVHTTKVRVAYEVCSEMVAADARMPPPRRRLLVSGVPSTAPRTSELSADRDERRAIARPLLTLVLAREPSPAEVEAGTRLLDDVARAGGSLADAATTACTAFLSGPLSTVLPIEGSLRSSR